MLNKFKKFLKNTSGSIVPTVGVLAIPLTITIGAAVDYSTFVNMRNQVQNSLDAAGLATIQQLAEVQQNVPDGSSAEQAKTFVETELEDYANDFMIANLGANYEKGLYQLNVEYIEGTATTGSSVKMTAAVEYDTIFGGWYGEDGGGLLNIDTIEEDLISIVTLGNRTVEVAMVLDNSGSMGGSRINTLRIESAKLVDKIHDSGLLSQLADPVQFSIVPFGGSVNVGKQYKNAKWIDKKGWANNHHENFDWLNSYVPAANEEVKRQGTGFRSRINGGPWQWKTRFDLFDMLGTEWEGCVEMRPYPHNVQDTWVNIQQNQTKVTNAFPKTPDNPYGGKTALFVPMFAPDEPDDDYLYDGSREEDDDKYRNNYLNDFKMKLPNGSIVDVDTDTNGSPVEDMHGSSRQIERTNLMFKYQANKKRNNSGSSSFSYSTSGNLGFGPNYGCTTDPILALTPSRSDAQTAILGLDAGGYTNIQSGLVWGWRTLSPGEPFTEGREKDDDRNLKFIVLLTDGNNTQYSDGDSTPNETAYSSWGYARPAGILDNPFLSNSAAVETHNRWVKGLTNEDLADTIYAGTESTFDLTPNSGGEYEQIMNAHTAQACENIKDDGISIYAVAFAVPNSGGVRDLLEACSGSGRMVVDEGTDDERVVNVVQGNNFYHDVDSNGLDTAFSSIAAEIAALRITQ